MYRVEVDELAKHQVDALPSHALAAYAELRAALEVAPWGGDPMNNSNPGGAVRNMTFGQHREGLATYLVLEDQRRVDVLAVMWLG